MIIRVMYRDEDEDVVFECLNIERVGTQSSTLYIYYIYIYSIYLWVGSKENIPNRIIGLFRVEALCGVYMKGGGEDT